MKRRIFPRYAAHRSIGIDVRGDHQHAELIDISMRGAGVRTSSPLPVDTALRVRLAADLELNAKVVFSKGVVSGVLFEAMQTADVARLRGWIHAQVGGHDVVTSMERFDVKGLSPARVGGILLQLDDVVARVFRRTEAGEVPLDAAGLLMPFLGSDLVLASLYIFRNQQNEPVGFCLITAARLVDAADRLVVRLCAGILPEYRGANLTLGPLLRQLLRLRASHPLKRLVLFTEMPDPSLYRLWMLHDLEVADAGDSRHAEELRSVADELWGERLIEADEGHLRSRLGFAVRQDAGERTTWSDDPLVRSFLQANPDYAEGVALAGLVPLDGSQLRGLLVRYGTRQLAKRAAPNSAVAVRLEDGKGIPVDDFGPWVRRSLTQRVVRRLRRAKRSPPGRQAAR